MISAPGLLIYVILISLAAIDWLMSLDPHWYSTIFGFILVAGEGMSAFCFGDHRAVDAVAARAAGAAAAGRASSTISAT